MRRFMLPETRLYGRTRTDLFGCACHSPEQLCEAIAARTLLMACHINDRADRASKRSTSLLIKRATRGLAMPLRNASTAASRAGTSHLAVTFCCQARLTISCQRMRGARSRAVCTKFATQLTPSDQTHQRRSLDQSSSTGSKDPRRITLLSGR